MGHSHTNTHTQLVLSSSSVVILCSTTCVYLHVYLLLGEISRDVNLCAALLHFQHDAQGLICLCVCLETGASTAVPRRIKKEALRTLLTCFFPQFHCMFVFFSRAVLLWSALVHICIFGLCSQAISAPTHFIWVTVYLLLPSLCIPALPCIHPLSPSIFPLSLSFPCLSLSNLETCNNTNSDFYLLVTFVSCHCPHLCPGSSWDFLL